MLRTGFVIAIVVACTLAATALSEGEKPGKPSVLERKVDVLRQRLEDADSEAKRLGKRIEAVEKYLAGRAAADASFAASLDAVEKAGFTYGINSRSRELLLEGLRKHLKSAAKGLPGGGTKPPAPPRRR